MSPRIDDKKQLNKYRLGFLISVIFILGITFIKFTIEDFVRSYFADGIMLGSLTISDYWIEVIFRMGALTILFLVFIKLPWYPKIREYLDVFEDREDEEKK